MQLTLDLPEELGSTIQQLRKKGDHFADEIAGILLRLLSLPSNEEVLALRASKPMQERIRELLAKNRDAGLTGDERKEMDRYLYFEEIVQLAKARAISERAGKQVA